MCMSASGTVVNAFALDGEDEQPPRCSPPHDNTTDNNTQLRQRSVQGQHDAAGATTRSLLPSSPSALAATGCLEEYATKRTMTPLQERINALTILPSAILCVHYMVTAQWLLPETLERAAAMMMMTAETTNATATTTTSCMDSTWMPQLPPPAVLAISLGILFHCPCSFLYHWKAASIATTTERLHHWSRRLDHSAIHACSNFWAYALSRGNVPFTLLNIIYNAECIHKHWSPAVVPRRNQIRILGSIVLYTLPLLIMHENQHALFYNLWLYIAVAVWLFAAYPVGGWSHSAFHMVMIFVPPLLLEFTSQLEANGDWALAAAQCALINGSSHPLR